MRIKTRQKIFLASLIYGVVMFVRKLLRKGECATFSRGGLMWNLDLKEGIDFSIFLRGYFEPDLVRYYRKFISKDEVILDVGANIGAHTLHFGSIVSSGGGKVIAVEATEYAFGKLKANIGMNERIISSVVPCHCMLVDSSDRDQELEIYSSWPLTGKDQKHEQHRGVLKTTGSAQVVTLDELLAQQGISKVDWMKLDVDGHELQVLRGAQNTLKEHHPKIIMELAHDYDGNSSQNDFNEMVQLLASYGYRFTEVSGKKLPSDSEKLKRLIPSGSSLNAVLI